MAPQWPSAPTISQTQDTGAPDIIRLQDYRPIKRRKLTRSFRDGRRQQRMRRSMSERPLDLGVGPHRNAVRPDTNLLNEILMSALFNWSGYGKLTAAANIDAYFASLGLPFPDLLRGLAVLIELGGRLALLPGIHARLSPIVLAVWCIATALAGHTNFADVDAQIHFMKNVAMTGGFIFIAALGPGTYSLLSAQYLIMISRPPPTGVLDFLDRGSLSARRRQQRAKTI